jgi:hypothetical protein
MQPLLAKNITEVEGHKQGYGLHGDLDVTAQSTRFIRVRTADGTPMS